MNELSRQGRRQLAAVERLAAEREMLLEQMIRTTEQLKANEASLRAADRLTRSVLDGVTEQSIIGSDLTGLIDVWNKGASAMLGLSSQEALGKRYVFEFHVDGELEGRSRELDYPPGATVLNPGFSALVESARLGRAEVRDWTYVRQDASTLSVSVAVTPRIDESGSTVGYIFVATDVTYALEVARLKDEFVGSISHELRTPLSSILGYLELMRDDDGAPLSDEQLLYLGVAERNAHRLLRLVGDLLFTAQVSAGTFPLDVSEVALVEVVSAAVVSAKPGATGAGVQLLVDLPLGAIFVPGDAVRLGQACDNLISNAVKFTPRGGTVTVSLNVSDSDAVVTVRDTGIGIPAAELDQLYTRFFRATTATRNAVPGVGLGLTITKAIVTAHEGEIDVESQEGVGTAISMRIPLSRRPALI
jgi:signal transduction histidine kinase